MTNSMQISNPQDMVQQFETLGFRFIYNYYDEDGNGVAISHDEIGLIYVKQVTDGYNIRYENPMSLEEQDDLTDQAIAARATKNNELYQAIMAKLKTNIIVSSTDEVFAHLAKL